MTKREYIERFVAIGKARAFNGGDLEVKRTLHAANVAAENARRQAEQNLLNVAIGRYESLPMTYLGVAI